MKPLFLLLLVTLSAQAEYRYRDSVPAIPNLASDPSARDIPRETDSLDGSEKEQIAPRKYPTPYESMETGRQPITDPSARWNLPVRPPLPIPGQLYEAKGSLWSDPIETSPPLPTGTW